MDIIKIIRAEIEKRTYGEQDFNSEDAEYGYRSCARDLLSFLDTLQELEHPIYQLNQILIDWVKEAPTDKEKDAREEAHKRFFDLYDGAMMQEPEVDLEKEENK